MGEEETLVIEANIINQIYFPAKFSIRLSSKNIMKVKHFIYYIYRDYQQA